MGDIIKFTTDRVELQFRKHMKKFIDSVEGGEYIEKKKAEEEISTRIYQDECSIKPIEDYFDDLRNEPQ